MRYLRDESIPSVAQALGDYHNSDDLRKLARLVTDSQIPKRKDELVALILEHLQGARLQALWGRMDKLEQAALSEVVHSSDGRFPAQRFKAKYGSEPGGGLLRLNR